MNLHLLPVYIHLLLYIARKLLLDHLVISFLFQSTTQTQSDLLQQQVTDIFKLVSSRLAKLVDHPKVSPSNNTNNVAHNGRTGRTALLNMRSTWHLVSAISKMRGGIKQYLPSSGRKIGRADSAWRTLNFGANSCSWLKIARLPSKNKRFWHKGAVIGELPFTYKSNADEQTGYYLVQWKADTIFTFDFSVFWFFFKSI